MQDKLYEESPLIWINRKLGTNFQNEDELRRYLRESMTGVNETFLIDNYGMESK